MNNNYQQNEAGLITAKRNVLYTTGCLFELTKWIIVVAIIFTLIHFFIATIYIVDGVSMEPNFMSGEIMIANRFQYNFGIPSRGDAVILKFPGDPDHKKYVKRIIGLPQEQVEIKNNGVYINSQKLNESYIPTDMKTNSDIITNITLKEDEYFLMGDNRPNSNDSRIWGPADRRFLIGRAWFEIWPKIKIIEPVKY